MSVHTCVSKCARNVGYLCHWGASFFEDIPLVEFMYLVFTRMPGESYHRRLKSLLLYLCYVFRALINSLECWFCTSALGLVLFQISERMCSDLILLYVIIITWRRTLEMLPAPTRSCFPRAGLSVPSLSALSRSHGSRGTPHLHPECWSVEG